MTEESTLPPGAEGGATGQSNIVDLIARKNIDDTLPKEDDPGASFAAGMIYVGAVVQAMLIMLIAQGIVPRGAMIQALAAIRASFEEIACTPDCEISQLLAQASAQISELIGNIKTVPEVPALDLQRLSASIAAMHGAQTAASMTINSIMLMSIAGGAIEVPIAKKWIEGLSKVAGAKINWNDGLQKITGDALQTKFKETLEHLDNAAAAGTSVDGSLIDPSLADGILH